MQLLATTPVDTWRTDANNSDIERLKYGAVTVGYMVLAFPVVTYFERNRDSFLKQSTI